jgi:transcriptional regulator with XRE-family HTH domain
MASRQRTSLRACVAKSVRSIRLARNLSQEQLAEIAGLHRTYISSVERQERNLTLETVERIARALEVGPLELFQGAE